ncbi:MAG: PKD domain-containing protein [Bacteroidota bacterium]
MKKVYLLISCVLWLQMNAHAQRIEWLNAYGGVANEIGSCFDTDVNGNSYAAGVVSSDAVSIFDTVDLRNTGNGGKMYLAKFNTQGRAIWAIRAQTSANPLSMSVNDLGEGYLAGVNGVSITFGGVTLPVSAAGQGGFVYKFDSLGNIAWGRKTGTIQNRAVACNNIGDVYVTGNNNSATPFPLELIKYDRNGTVRWRFSFTSVGPIDSYSLDTDDTGDVYIAGTFRTEIRYRGTRRTLPAPFTFGVFAAKLDSTGALQYLTTGGTTRGASGTLPRIAATSNGEAYFMTEYRNQLSFGGVVNLTTPNLAALAVIYLGANGTPTWGIQAEGSNTGTGFLSVDIQESGNVAYVLGRNLKSALPADLYFPPDTIPIQSNFLSGVYISKIENTGNFLWTEFDAQPNFNFFPGGIGVDSLGNAFFNENFRDSISFQNIDLISQTGPCNILGSNFICDRDFFIAKIADVSLFLDSVAAGPFCAGDTIQIPFRAEGAIRPGTQFTALLSDPTGALNSRLPIGSLVGGVGPDTLTAVIPAGVAFGTNYRFVVESDTPRVRSFDNGQRFTISPPPVADAGPDSSLCPGDTAVLLGSGGVQYAWSPGGLLNDSTVAQPLTATPGQYVLTLGNAFGCSDTDTVEIIGLAAPPLATSPDTAVCLGQSTVLAAQSPASLLWSTAATTAQITVSPLVNQVYTVVATDSAGCRSFDSVLVAVNSLPIVSLGADTAVCAGDSVVLLATAPTAVSYLWNTASVQPSISVTPAMAQNYSLTVTDSLSCENADTVLINVRVLPVVTAGLDTAVCLGDSVGLLASSPTAVGFLWDNGMANAGISVGPLADQNYVVTGTDGFGCSSADTVLVSVRPLPVATASQPFVYVCDGRPIPLTATGGVDYTWFPDNTLDSLLGAVVTARPPWLGRQVVDTATYTVVVADTFGCKDTASVKVPVRQLPPLLPPPTETFSCRGDVLQLTATAPLGGSFLWSNGDTASSTSVVLDSNSTISLTLTDRWGCEDTAVTEVYVPRVTAFGDTAVCTGQPVQVGAIIPGGLSYAWDNGLQGSPAFFVLEQSQTLAVTATDSLGCTDRDSVSLTAWPLPVVVAAPDTGICIGDEITLQANAQPSVQLLWNIGSTASTIEVTPQIETNYTVTATDTRGCAQSDTVTVEVYPLPAVAITGDTRACEGELAQLIAASPTAISFLWNDGETVDLRIITATESQGYTVLVTDDRGCQQTDSTFLEVILPPEVILDTLRELCQGQAVQLEAEGADAYLWSTGEVENPITFTPIASTTLWVIGTAEGCTSDTATVRLDVERPPRASFSLSPEFGSVPLTVAFATPTQAATYRWDFGDGASSEAFDPQHIYTQPGTYDVQLIVTTARGCRDTSLLEAAVTIEAGRVFFPNAFTPNGDQHNNTFGAIGEGFGNPQLHIFNRWGRVIYQGAGPWDGRTETGRDAPEGVYTYTWQANGPEGRVIRRSGTVTVVR